jgi:hypothetical protein
VKAIQILAAIVPYNDDVLHANAPPGFPVQTRFYGDDIPENQSGATDG